MQDRVPLWHDATAYALMAKSYAINPHNVNTDHRSRLRASMVSAIVNLVLDEELRNLYFIALSDANVRVGHDALLPTTESRILETGLDELDDQQLRHLATTPVALQHLAREVEESFPPVWINAHVVRGSRILSQSKGPQTLYEQMPIPSCVQDLRGSGPVQFPGGTIADGAWQIGRLFSLPPHSRDDLLELLATHIYLLLMKDIHVDVGDKCCLVCFGIPMFEIARRVAQLLTINRRTNVENAYAAGFCRPVLAATDTVVRGAHVIYLVDVLRSGGLLTRLDAVCRQAHPASVAALALIDLSEGRTIPLPYSAVWASARGRRLPHIDMVPEWATGAQLVKEYVPDLGLAVAVPRNWRQDKRRCEALLGHWAQLMTNVEKESGVQIFHRDIRIGDRCYPVFIDIAAFLANCPDAREALLMKSAKQLRPLSSHFDHDWCIVYAAWNPRSHHWAELLSYTCGVRTIAVGRPQDSSFVGITQEQSAEIGKYRCALIADIAIRSGDTCAAIATQLRSHPETENIALETLYILDGLSDDARCQLQTCLNIRITSVLPPFELYPPMSPVTSRIVDDALQRFSRQRHENSCDSHQSGHQIHAPDAESHATGYADDQDDHVMPIMSTTLMSSATEDVRSQCVRLHNLNMAYQAVFSGVGIGHKRECIRILSSTEIGEFGWLDGEWLDCNASSLWKSDSDSQHLWKCVWVACTLLRKTRRDVEITRVSRAFSQMRDEYIDGTRYMRRRAGNLQRLWRAHNIQLRCECALRILQDAAQLPDEKSPEWHELFGKFKDFSQARQL